MGFTVNRRLRLMTPARHTGNVCRAGVFCRKGIAVNVLAVMVGGFLGGVCRYVLGERLYTESGFPFGTLCVNVAGCFFLGWLLTTVSQKSKVSRPLTLLGGTGFLGSFTTFSTFSAETVCLVRAHEMPVPCEYFSD